jgi:hypothetical protein
MPRVVEAEMQFELSITAGKIQQLGPSRKWFSENLGAEGRGYMAAVPAAANDREAEGHGITLHQIEAGGNEC